MKNLFDKIEIKTIEFQTNCEEVSVKCVVSQGGVVYTNELIINFSDLNRLINKIQKITKIMDLFSYFKTTNLENGDSLYYLSNEEDNELNLPLYEMNEFNPIRQIRA
jgi:hypothetical protein